MPVYEFYCPDCHRIFNFMSRRMNTTKRPDCPKCGRPKIERQVSLFAVSRGLKEEADEPDLPDLDEAKMERAMEELAGEADRIDEEDPKQMARIMRKLYGSTGMDMGPGMEEAMRRMEAGEDPDRIEADLGDVLESEDPFLGGGKKGKLRDLRKKITPPSKDDKLYDL
ncbi:MAG: FmdB family zinc ribbon protein [Planctomycetota bacterium]|jgi:putative FmdB family regulatory protein